MEDYGKRIKRVDYCPDRAVLVGETYTTYGGQQGAYHPDPLPEGEGARA